MLTDRERSRLLAWSVVFGAGGPFDGAAAGRLDFARWLLQTGRITDELPEPAGPADSGAPPEPPPPAPSPAQESRWHWRR